MRVLVLLKGNYFYICSARTPSGRDGYRRFRLANGGDVEIPEENIIAVETYTDYTIEMFRHRLGIIEASKEWTQLTNES